MVLLNCIKNYFLLLTVQLITSLMYVLVEVYRLFQETGNSKILNSKIYRLEETNKARNCGLLESILIVF